MKWKGNWQYLIIIFIAALIMNLFVYFQYGITLAPDSYWYITYSEEILTGNWYDPHMFWYIHYAISLIFFKMVFGTYDAIVPFQITLHIISCCFLFLIIRKEIGSNKLSLAIVLFYILWFKIVTWNVFVLTDSLFVSFSIITIYLWLQLFKTGKNLIVHFLLLYITFFIRPVGFLLFVALAFGAFQFLGKSSFNAGQLRIVAIISGTLLIGLFIRMQSTLETTKEYAKGDIVYHASTADERFNTSYLVLETENLKNNDKKGFRGIAQFALQNPIYFADMSLRKLFFFTLQVRPYYSIKHNLFLLLTLIPIYVFSIIGWKNLKNDQLKNFSIVYILSTISMAMIITLDWDGRFFLPIFPVLMILAAIGIKQMIVSDRFNSVFKSKS